MLPLLLLLVLPSTDALAHGGAPSALGLVAARADGAQIVVLNEGLAIKRPAGWSYLCPSLWGETDLASGKSPLARSASGVETWLPGAEDLYLLRDQRLIAQERPEFRRDTMIALANDATHVYGLHYTGIGEYQSAEIVRLSTEQESTFWRSDVYWSAITANVQGVYAARIVSGNEMEVVALDSQGLELTRSRATLPLTPWEMQLQALGDRVYLTANDGKLWLVGYFVAGTWTEVLQDTSAIIGPQASPDDTEWLAVGGSLRRLRDGLAEATDETRMITCLERWNDVRYACVGSDLHLLTASGVGERVFELNGFQPPDPELVPLARKESCELQWTLYNSDATRSGLTFAASPTIGAAGGAASVMTDVPVSGTNAPSPLGAAGATGATSSATAGSSSPPSSRGCGIAVHAQRGGRELYALLCACLGVAWRTRIGRRRREAQIRVQRGIQCQGGRLAMPTRSPSTAHGSNSGLRATDIHGAGTSNRWRL